MVDAFLRKNPSLKKLQRDEELTRRNFHKYIQETYTLCLPSRGLSSPGTQHTESLNITAPRIKNSFHISSNNKNVHVSMLLRSLLLQIFLLFWFPRDVGKSCTCCLIIPRHKNFYLLILARFRAWCKVAAWLKTFVTRLKSKTIFEGFVAYQRSSIWKGHPGCCGVWHWWHEVLVGWHGRKRHWKK